MSLVYMNIVTRGDTLNDFVLVGAFVVAVIFGESLNLTLTSFTPSENDGHPYLLPAQTTEPSFACQGVEKQETPTVGGTVGVSSSAEGWAGRLCPGAS